MPTERCRLSTVLLLLLLALPGAAAGAMVAVGQPAPPVRVVDPQAREVVLGARSADRALLVMFSSVGCVPCRESEPVLAKIARDLGDRVEVAVVLLAGPDRVQEVLRAGAAEPALPVFSDSAGEGLFPLAGVYGVLGTPTSFLVGRDGRVLWRHVGRITPEHLASAIPAALGGGVVSRR